MNVKTPKKFGRGDGTGKGGPKQKDGGAKMCVCPKCGYTEAHAKGQACSLKSCPKCGTKMQGR